MNQYEPEQNIKQNRKMWLLFNYRVREKTHRTISSSFHNLYSIFKTQFIFLYIKCLKTPTDKKFNENGLYDVDTNLNNISFSS